MVALLCHFFLEVLRIVDTDHLKARLFIDAEQQYAAAVLVGEAGQRVIQPLGAIIVGGFAFNRLCLCPLFANRFS